MPTKMTEKKIANYEEQPHHVYMEIPSQGPQWVQEILNP